MKIALFTDGIYPYVIGGMQKHSFYLAKYLAREKVFVDLYHTNSSSFDISKLEYFSEEEKRYIQSIVIPFPEGDGLPGHYLRASADYSKKIFNIFRANSKVDFIYAKGFTAWQLLKEKQQGYVCAPVGLNFHGYEMFQKAPDLKTWLQHIFLLRKPLRYNIQQADYLFSYGGKITPIIKKLISQPHKIIELPSGIEAQWVKKSAGRVNNPLKFIFIGRNERRKGIEELNEVIKKLQRDHRFVFTFIGPIPENKRLKLAGVQYTGSVSDIHVIKTSLSNSDVLVCPSHSEGMPNVILEGMASGLSVIATDVGAVREMVGPDNGVLTQAGNSTQLQQAMIRMLEMNKAELETMKNNSIEKVKQSFLWESIILATIDRIKEKIAS